MGNLTTLPVIDIGNAFEHNHETSVNTTVRINLQQACQRLANATSSRALFIRAWTATTFPKMTTIIPFVQLIQPL